MAIGSGSVWVANAGDQTLARVDPTTKQVVDRIGVSHNPTEVAFGQGAVRSASAIGYRGVVSRVDQASRSVVANNTVRIGAGASDDLFASPTPSAIAVDSNGVFTNDLHSRVWRLSSAGRASTFSLGVSHSFDAVALGADDYQSAGIDLFLHQTGHRHIYLLDDGQGTGLRVPLTREQQQ